MNKRSAPGSPFRSGGFTLLELIAVIGIIAIMAVIVVGGFTGMSTAIGQNTSAQTLERALNLARQLASVDDADVYLRVVDVNRFAIVRKAGVVTRRMEGEYPLGPKGAKVDAVWVFDRYADLSDREEYIGDIEVDANGEATDAALKTISAKMKDYDGMLAFDLDDGTFGQVTTPATFQSGYDSYVFGLKPGTKGFDCNHAYGWLSHTVFSLADGWVFSDTYNEETGAFNMKRADELYTVLYTPGGNIAREVTFKVENPSKKRSFSIDATASGVTRGSDTGGSGN